MIRNRPNPRSGVTLVESAVIFLVFFGLVLGMFDLGMGVFQMHLLQDAARHIARQARVHGDQADRLGSWGPATVGPLAGNESHPVCAEACRVLPGIDPATIRITLEWLDGGNSEGQQVRVTITIPYPPSVTLLWEQGATLQAQSTTVIAH